MEVDIVVIATAIAAMTLLLRDRLVHLLLRLFHHLRSRAISIHTSTIEEQIGANFMWILKSLTSSPDMSSIHAHLGIIPVTRPVVSSTMAFA